jgi:predicted CxxxxCH...CXXCH cytochrome family protein
VDRKYKKLRDSARGENCTLRIHPYCNGNPETTVLCHVSTGTNSGMGIKPPDWFAIYACSGCHDVIDRRVNVPMNITYDLTYYKLDALFETQARMIEKGLICIK